MWPALIVLLSIAIVSTIPLIWHRIFPYPSLQALMTYFSNSSLLLQSRDRVMGRLRRKGRTPSPVKPKRAKQWNNESIAAVQDKGISSNHAAKLFGVPPSTLKDRLSGRVLHGTKPGPVQRFLGKNKQTELYTITAGKKNSSR